MVVTVNVREIEVIKKELENNDKIHMVELDGRRIKTWKDYISEIQNKFQFPTTCFDSIDRYLDWMRDLEWLNKEGYVLIINNYCSFFKNTPEIKNEIISDIDSVILPFWREQVKDRIAKGKNQVFTVYLVD